MKHILLAVIAPFLLALAPAAYAEDAAEAAGYVIAYDLKGVDLQRGTAVIRNGQELPPKLWMTLLEGDTVFIHDPASSIVLDVANGGRIEVKGAKQRVTVGEGESSSGTWEIVTEIAELFSSEEGEDAPTNLMSKGDDSLAAPMAVRGPNFILRDERPVWVAWRGGKGPYNLAIDIDGVRTVLGTRTETEAEIAVPETAKSRFALLIGDAYGARLRIALKFRETLPEMPKDLADQAAQRGAAQAVLAGWLAAQDDGAWRIEVARLLRTMPKDKTAQRLISALAEGWRPHN
jgi:hypothetical protein